jgi:hypothetical protein
MFLQTEKRQAYFDVRNLEFVGLGSTYYAGGYAWD